MRDYNILLINREYALIEIFLFNADKNILDISYSIKLNIITFQIVMLKGTNLSKEKRDKLFSTFSSYEISINEIYLDKEQFNQNKGDWRPIHYDWLDNNVLFSKAEEL